MRFRDPLNPPNAATRCQLFKESQRDWMLPQANAGDKIFPAFREHFGWCQQMLLKKHGLHIPDLPPVDEAAALSPEDAEELRRTAESHDNVVVSEEESEEESEDEDEPDPRAQLERAIAQLTAEERPPRQDDEQAEQPPPPPRQAIRENRDSPPPLAERASDDQEHSDGSSSGDEFQAAAHIRNRALFLANASRGISGSSSSATRNSKTSRRGE